jgi:DNA replication protein DnaC
VTGPERPKLAEVVERIRAVAPAPEPHPAPARPGELADLPHPLEERRRLGWARAIPSRFVWAQLEDLTDHDPDTRTALADWSGEPRGRNLVLLGPVGTGKTHAAVAAVRALHDRGDEVVFLPVVELLDQLRPGGPEHALSEYAHADVLVLDDLGAERPTEWTGERLYALINRRWLEERPTVATTNLDPDPLRTALGERVFSRLVGNDAVVLRLAGKDRRRRHGA